MEGKIGEQRGLVFVSFGVPPTSQFCVQIEELFHNHQWGASSTNEYFQFVHRVADTTIFYAQEYVHYEKIMDQVGTEPVTIRHDLPENSCIRGVEREQQMISGRISIGFWELSHGVSVSFKGFSEVSWKQRGSKRLYGHFRDFESSWML